MTPELSKSTLGSWFEKRITNSERSRKLSAESKWRSAEQYCEVLCAEALECADSRIAREVNNRFGIELVP